MKPLKFLFVILAFAIWIPQLLANDPTLLFSVTANNLGRLGVVNSSSKTLYLTIETSNGDEVFRKAIPKSSNYFEYQDLGKLPNGHYFVSLSGSGKTLRKRFEIEKNGIKVIKELEYDPRFRVVNQVLYVQMANDNRSSVSLSLELNDEIVFEDKGMRDELINKKYSINSLPKGSYIVKLQVEGQLFKHEFKVN